MTTPPTAGQSTQTTTPAATHLAASFPLDVARDAGDGTTAATASATDPNPATAGLPADEQISSFLLCIRRRADDKAASLVLDAAPPDNTGAGVAADPAPGVTVPVITAGPTTDMDGGTADGLLPVIADFDPTSAWGDGDEATAAIAAVPTTRKRKRMAAARAGDTDGGATATGRGGDAVVASVDVHGSATKKRRRKQSRPITRDVQRHSQRKTELETARGNTPRSGPGPVEGRPAEDWAEWRRS